LGSGWVWLRGAGGRGFFRLDRLAYGGIRLRECLDNAHGRHGRWRVGRAGRVPLLGQCGLGERSCCERGWDWGMRCRPAGAGGYWIDHAGRFRLGCWRRCRVIEQAPNDCEHEEDRNGANEELSEQCLEPAGRLCRSSSLKLRAAVSAEFLGRLDGGAAGGTAASRLFPCHG
jgi:hypothetical protein